MKSSKIFSIVPCGKKTAEKIANGLNQYNLSKVAALADLWTPMDFVAENKEGSVIGGILAGIGYWKGLEIKILWVK